MSNWVREGGGVLDSEVLKYTISKVMIRDKLYQYKYKYKSESKYFYY